MTLDLLRHGFRFGAALVIVATLAACGGGGSDSTAVTEAPVGTGGGAPAPAPAPTPAAPAPDTQKLPPPAQPSPAPVPLPSSPTPSPTVQAPAPSPVVQSPAPSPSPMPSAPVPTVTVTAGGTTTATTTAAIDPATILAAGRNSTEFRLAASQHPYGVTLTTRVFLPDSTSPMNSGTVFPVAFGYHGSGGLHVEPAVAGNTCTQNLETTYAQMTTFLLSQGVAVVWIDSFFSRDPRFCEDNSPAFQAFAPPLMDSGLQQVIARVYDTVAAETAFCKLARFDCGHMMRIGTSEGGTAVLVPSHRFLDHSLQRLFVPGGPGNKLADLPLISYTPVPASRPVPKFVMAISPGCGFFSAIPQSTTGDTQDLFYPLHDTYIEIGGADSIPDECATAVGQGRRELQALEVQSREAIAAPAYRYRPTIYPGMPHALWPAQRTALEAKLTTLIQQYLK